MCRVTCRLPHCVPTPLIVWKTLSARCDRMGFRMKGLISEFKVKVCGFTLGLGQASVSPRHLISQSTRLIYTQSGN